MWREEKNQMISHLLITVKNIATEIQVPKSAGVWLICVAFQVSAHVQWPAPTEIFRSVQLLSG